MSAFLSVMVLNNGLMQLSNNGNIKEYMDGLYKGEILLHISYYIDRHAIP